MAVTADGGIIGSISGGCVEGDAVVLAHTARVTGVAQSARLGFSDEAAHAAGLACGGSVDVVAYPVPADAAALDALERAAAGRAATYLLPGGIELTIDPAPRLFIVGAGEHAAALCRVASAAGYRVTVIDVWASLVTRDRFPDADELVVGMPDEHLEPGEGFAAVCVLSHDERLDVPALATALRAGFDFVGAMGARGTVAHRADLLRARGVTGPQLERVHSPLGLDLGGRSPAETAIAVLAEITASRHDGTGLPLRDLTGAIHRPTENVIDVDAQAGSIRVTPSACAPLRPEGTT